MAKARRGQFVAGLRFPRTRERVFVRSAVVHDRMRQIEIPSDLRSRVFIAAGFPDVLPIRAMPDIAGFKPAVPPGHPFGDHDHRRVGGARADRRHDEASTTRSPSSPCPRSWSSTTLIAWLPIISCSSRDRRSLSSTRRRSACSASASFRRRFRVSAPFTARRRRSYSSGTGNSGHPPVSSGA